MFATTTVCLLLTVCLIIFYRFVRPSKKIYDFLCEQGIRHEPFVPILGQLNEIRRARERGELLEFHSNLQKKHGRIYLFCLGPFPRLVIDNAVYLNDILGPTQAANFNKPTDFASRLKPLIGVENILVTNGYEHERARKMLNPAFYHSNLKSMVSIMTTETSRSIENSLEGNDEIDLTKYFSALTLSIIASCAFGRSFKTTANAHEIIETAFSQMLAAVGYRAARLLDTIPVLSSLPFWKKDIVDRGSQRINCFVDQIITDRRQGLSESLCAGPDLLDLLLQAVDANGDGFSDQQIKDQALTFVLAGHETTSNLMSWTMYILMTNPQIFQDCRDEVDRILPNQTVPNDENLKDLAVIEAVLHETLRLYPPAPFFIRASINEQTIGSKSDRPIRILPGTTILINSYSIHRREEYWPRPNEFDYHRWLRDPQTGFKAKLAHPYCFLPFAAGPRDCIGRNFALLEAKVILALLVQRCDFQLVPGQKIVPEIRITMRPKHGLFAKVKPRENYPTSFTSAKKNSTNNY